MSDETDPYCWPGTTCLRNKLGIRDADELRPVEARIVNARDRELIRRVLPGDYDLDHLRRFHRTLFGDIYDWAGEIRTVDIAKANSMFCLWPYVEAEVTGVLRGIQNDGLLAGLERDEFVVKLAHYYGELNARHPFREGNGRTQRAYFRQLAAAAGWRVNWAGIDTEDNIRACQLNHASADPAPLWDLLDPVISAIDAGHAAVPDHRVE